MSLLLFNPSHEMALAANSPQYTPTRPVRLMEEQLALMPSLWADADDLILTPQGIVDINGRPADVYSGLRPEPWGWNKAVRNRFLRLGISPHLMPTEAELDDWRTLASRRFAVDYAGRFYAALASPNPSSISSPNSLTTNPSELSKKNLTDLLVPNNMSFCDSAIDIARWREVHTSDNFILKSEYSSSGRGNRIFNVQPTSSATVPNRNLGSLHGGCIDVFYRKILDFAMEFEVTPSEVRYLGLSVFEASTEGRYGCNYVLSQSELTDIIAQAAPQIAHTEQLSSLAAHHHQLLAAHLLHRYRGYVGIDMMVVEHDGQPRIHPCVELNLRMNMGILALRLHTRLSNNLPLPKILTIQTAHSPSNTPLQPPPPSFHPVIDNGKFYIKQ